MKQLEFDYKIDIATQCEINYQDLKNQIDKLRKNYFARIHDLEKEIMEKGVDIEFLKREIEALKIYG